MPLKVPIRVHSTECKRGCCKAHKMKINRENFYVQNTKAHKQKQKSQCNVIANFGDRIVCEREHRKEEKKRNSFSQ